MPRFVCVQGVPGLLVGHPHKKGREFVGKRPRSAEDIEAIRVATGKVSLVDRYDDCVEVVDVSGGDPALTIDKAIASGALKVVSPKQRHPDLARAVAKMTPHSDPTAGPKKAAKHIES